MAELGTLSVNIQGTDNITPALTKVIKKFDDVEKKVNEAEKKLNSMGDNAPKNFTQNVRAMEKTLEKLRGSFERVSTNGFDVLSKGLPQERIVSSCETIIKSLEKLSNASDNPRIKYDQLAQSVLDNGKEMARAVDKSMSMVESSIKKAETSSNRMSSFIDKMSLIDDKKAAAEAERRVQREISNTERLSAAYEALKKRRDDAFSIMRTSGDSGLASQAKSVMNTIDMMLSKIENFQHSPALGEKNALAQMLGARYKSVINEYKELKSLEGIVIAQQNNKAWTKEQDRLDKERSSSFAASLKHQMLEEQKAYEERIKQAEEANKRLTKATDEYERGKSSSFAAALKAQMEEEQRLYDLRVKQATDANIALNAAQDKLNRDRASIRAAESKSAYQAYFAEQDKKMKSAEAEAKRINSAYDTAVKNANKKLNNLTHIRENISKKISEATKAGLDTSALQRQMTMIQNYIKEARKLAFNADKITLATKSNKTRMTPVEELYEKVKAISPKIAEEMRRIDREMRNVGNNRNIRATARDLDKLHESALNASNVMSRLKSMLYQFAPVYGFQQMAMSIIEIGGEIEKQHIALRSIIGDIRNADTLFEKTKGLALQSPFTFGDLNKDTKQLAAYGIKYHELYETTKRLADISSGLGVSFERIALAYGQTKARSWLDAKELRQFAYAGLPLLQKLSEMYSASQGRPVTTAEVRKMIQSRQVAFEDVQDVLWKLTDAGGQFHNMQMILSETLVGRFNKMKDAWEIMLSEFAKGDNIVGGSMKTILNGITSILLNVQKVIPFLATMMGFLSARKIIQFLQVTDAMTGVKGKFQSMVGAFGGWANLGIATVLGGLATLYTRVDETKNKILQTSTEAQQRSKDIAEFFNSVGQKPKDNDGLIQSIKTMKEFLQDKTAYFGYIEQEANKIDDLSERYDYYVKKLNEVKIAQDALAGNAGFSQRLIESTGGLQTIGGFWKSVGSVLKFDFLNDNIDTNLKDWQDYEEVLAKASVNIQGHLTELAKAIKFYVGNDEKLARRLEGKDTLSQLQYIYKEFGKEGISNVVYRYSNEAGDAVKEYLNTLEDVNEAKNEVWKDVKELNKQLHNELKKMGISDPSKMNEEQRQKISEFISRFIDDLKNGTEDMKNQINKWIIRLNPNIVIDPTISVKEKNNPYKNQNSLSKQIIKNIVDKYGNGVTTVKEVEEFAGTSENPKSEEEALEAIKKKREDAYKRWRAAKRFKLKKAEAYKKEYERLEKIADANGVENELKDKWSSKNKNGRNEDNQLRVWRNELDLMKKVNAEYKKYEELYGNVEAKKFIEKQFDIASLRKILGDTYDVSNRNGNADLVEAWLKGLNKSTEQRKRMYQEGQTWVAEERLDVAKEETAARVKLAKEEYENRKKDWKKYEEMRSKYGYMYASSSTAGRLKGINGSYGTVINGEATIIGSKRRPLEYDDYLKNIITSKDKNGISHSLEEMLSATDDKLKEWFGADSYDTNIVRDAISEYKNRMEEFKYSGIDVINTMKDGLVDMTSEINKIDNELAENVRRIKNDTTLSETGKSNAINSLTKESNFKKYKYSEDYWRLAESGMNYGKALTNLYYIEFIKKLDDEFSSGRITAEKYKEEIKNINKAQKEARNKNVLNVSPGEVANGMQSLGEYNFERGSRAREFAKLLKEQSATRDYEGINNTISELGSILGEDLSKFKGSYEELSDYASNAGSSMMQFGEKQMEGAEKMNGTIEIIDKIVKYANGIVQGLKKTFDYVNELEESYGNYNYKYDESYVGITAFAASSQSATDGWESFKNGDFGGVLSGVVGSITKPIVVLNKSHDEKLQKQINELQIQTKYLNSISSSTEKFFDNELGGTYRTDAKYQNEAGKLSSIIVDTFSKIDAENGLDTTMKYEVAASNWRNSARSGKTDITGGEDAIKAYKYADSASKSGAYYELVMAQKYYQLANLKSQLAAEEGKKGSDDSTIADYKAQIQEAEDELKYLTQEIANSLYGVDFKDFAKQLTDALVSAWKNGENAAESYKKTVSNILADVVASAIQAKYMEKMLEPIMDKFMSQFESDNWKITDKSMAILAEMYDLEEEAQTAIFNAMDAVENIAQSKGTSIKDSDSSSLSSSIKGVTEDTADLLASYINAIRADVSVNRGYLEVIANNSNAMVSLMGGSPAGIGNSSDEIVMYASAINSAMTINAQNIQRIVDEQMPTVHNYLATQIGHLKSIEYNTERSANASEEILDAINYAVNGVKPINVKVS